MINQSCHCFTLVSNALRNLDILCGRATYAEHSVPYMRQAWAQPWERKTEPRSLDNVAEKL
eukprot:SAG11_NODE_33382_length_277_cov_1.735955_1_plen_60_part_01